MNEGGTGIFGFAVLDVFFIGFSVFVSKDFGFSVLVFIKNASGFSVLVPDVVFGFSYFFFPILYAVFGFGRFCLRFCGFG